MATNRANLVGQEVLARDRDGRAGARRRGRSDTAIASGPDWHMHRALPESRRDDAGTATSAVVGSRGMRTHADEATAWLSDKQRAMEQALAPLVSVNSFTENPEGGRQAGLLLARLFDIPGVTSTARSSERF